MKFLKKYKALLLCFMSLFFMAGMCEKDSDVGVDVVLVKSIEFDYTEVQLEEGKTLTLSFAISPENASNKSLSWKSSNENVATVKAAKITAVSQGSAVITATTKDGSGVTATCVVTVTPKTVKVESVTLEPKRMTLMIGETKSISAKVLPESAGNKELQWVSDDSSVASVENGEVKAVAKGVALITATAKDGSNVNGACLVTVEADSGQDPEEPGQDAVLVKSISLSREDVELYVGESVTVSATVLPENAKNKALAWESRNPNVAFVENGKITAVSAGTALVTVKATDGSDVKAYCVVSVLPVPTPDTPETPDNPDGPGTSDPDPDDDVVMVTKITLNKESATLNVGEDLELTATIYPKEATEKSLRWNSSNSNVAAVQDGWVVAIAPGQATIKATAKDGSGVSASCVITVSKGGAMSPVEAKNKMEAAGITFVNTIKAETHQNLVDVMMYYAENLDYDLDEAYYEKLANLVEETGGDEEYAHSVNPVQTMAELMSLSLDMANNSAQLATRAADVYMLTVKAGLKDLYGKFTPDTYNEVWKYQSSTDRIEFSFKDDKKQQWVATLKGSAETSKVHITGKENHSSNNYWNGELEYSESYISMVDYSIEVPKKITFVVKCGGTSVIDMTLNSELAFEANVEMESEYNHYSDYYNSWSDDNVKMTWDLNYSNLNLDAVLKVNGYEETFTTNITKQGVSASAGVKINGRSMINANAAIKANMDALIADAKDEDFKVSNIQNFSMNFDVLGEVQVDAECPNFKNLYDATMYLEDAYGIDEVNNWLEEVNNAYTAKLRFDNTSTTQATFEIEAEEDNDYYDESSIYFYPVIVFASNGTRHAIEDYFTASAFSDLLDAIERLADNFESQYGDYFEEESYPDYGGR